mmetsp:Transcript_41170/g.86352  ORF Transcript_41170/g.86352 Transcript_41170/m.86352 type:complete len:133 (-) Transcript_41170:154-552(-)
MQSKPAPVPLHRVLQLGSDEDVVLRLIRVEEGYRDVGVGFVAEDGVHYLEHGGDAGASGDHAEATGGSLLVWVSFEDGVDGEATVFAVGHVTCREKEEVIGEKEHRNELHHIAISTCGTNGEHGMASEMVMP